VQPVVELKSHGFSPDSSTSRQARKLIVSASDLSASLAEPAERRGHVIYATDASDSAQMASTLKELVSELEARHAPAAPTAVIGFVEDDQGVHLTSPIPEDLPSPASHALSEPVIVLPREDQNDLQPLYFIPWVPGNEHSQAPKLRSDGLRELTARLLVHALAEVGQAQPPTELVLNGTQLLSKATYGIFDHWRDTDRKHFGRTAATILTQALKRTDGVRRVSDEVLTLDLPSAHVQDSVIDRLRNADPADPSANLEVAVSEQETLF
jgi:hypothetical protein